METAFNRKSQTFSHEYARALANANHATSDLGHALFALRYNDEKHVDYHLEKLAEAEGELRKALKRLAPFH